MKPMKMKTIRVLAVQILMTSYLGVASASTIADHGTAMLDIVNNCPDPYSLKQGVLRLESDKSSVEYTCRPGYFLVGSSIASCDDGRWSSEPPICVGLECPAISIRHGSLIVSHGGGLVKVKCRRGFDLVGPYTLACLEGQWNGTNLPTCIAAGTPTTSLDTTAAETTDDDESKLNHEQWLKKSDYTCISSESTVSPPNVRNARYFMQWAMHNGSPRLYANYQCNWGFVSASGKRTVYCRQGQWIGNTPKCIYFNSIDDNMLQSDVHGSASHLSHDDLLRQADYTCIGSTIDENVDPPVPDRAVATVKFVIADGKPHLYARYSCGGGSELEDPDRSHMYCKRRTWVGLLPRCVDASEVGDLCLVNNGRCQHVCASRNGVIKCSCKPGFILADDQHTCLDIDECEENNANCQQICDNVEGGFTCGCYDGYQLNTDGTTCSSSFETRK